MLAIPGNKEYNNYAFNLSNMDSRDMRVEEPSNNSLITSLTRQALPLIIPMRDKLRWIDPKIIIHSKGHVCTVFLMSLEETTIRVGLAINPLTWCKCRDLRWAVPLKKTCWVNAQISTGIVTAIILGEEALLLINRNQCLMHQEAPWLSESSSQTKKSQRMRRSLKSTSFSTINFWTRLHLKEALI